MDSSEKCETAMYDKQNSILKKKFFNEYKKVEIVKLG